MSSLVDIENAINKYGILDAAAGGMFVFKGKYKAALINYLSHEEKAFVIMKNVKNALQFD
ncbi:hypothetical protein [Asinibacterium sp. OR53]|uniref:hypothetical protein n=1 Tax=Asinibacterium sp. OR53 TaxID=925409 RepID=UPI00047C8DFE|nr:hypothetical protein [Asinibacterium sp. OR53]